MEQKKENTKGRENKKRNRTKSLKQENKIVKKQEK